MRLAEILELEKKMRSWGGGGGGFGWRTREGGSARGQPDSDEGRRIWMADEVVRNVSRNFAFPR